MATKKSAPEKSKHAKKTASAKTGKKSAGPTAGLTADQFLKKLATLASAAEREKIKRYFKEDHNASEEEDVFIGARMGQVFALAKTFMNMEPDEIEKLLDSPIHEARTGAVSIMDFQARHAKTSAARLKELFDLYIQRHDRINNWDLVDRAAPYVVGGYLADKPRTVLYRLARSKNVWERRTAIVSSYYFIRKGDTADTFALAEILVNDPHDLIHKAVGGWLREAGKKDNQQLLHFLDKHASTMPRTALRYAIEKLDARRKKHYLSLKQQTGGDK